MKTYADLILEEYKNIECACASCVSREHAAELARRLKKACEVLWAAGWDELADELRAIPEEKK